MDNEVILQCVKEHGKLRVKIISNGYNRNANCQFPKNIRQENRKYKVPAYAIKVVQRGADKFFYNVNKANIKIIDTEDVESIEDAMQNLNIYEVSDCCICLEEKSEMVMVPCGHLCLCNACSSAFKEQKCPMCRSVITMRINKSQLI